MAIDETIPPNARGAARSKRGNQGQTRHQQLLMCLRAAADGDFSVRVPAPPEAGIDGDIARAFNALVSRTEALTQELVRVERVVGREGRMNELVTLGPRHRRLELGASLDQRAHRRPRAADDRGLPRHQRGRRGRPQAEDGARDRGAAGQGRVPAHRHDRQLRWSIS